MEEWVVNTFIRGLALGTPLLWAALGEIYAERSGVVNLGVEGMMILGAFSAFALAQTTANPLLGLLIAAGAGALVRYLAVIFGGALAGVGGGFLSVAYRPSWTEGMTNGLGWIAIAIAIFASWDPLRAVAGAFLFGALFHLSFRLQTWVAPEPLQMM